MIILIFIALSILCACVFDRSPDAPRYPMTDPLDIWVRRRVLDELDERDRERYGND